MYLKDLDKHLPDHIVKAIEDTSTFKVFLIRFGLHNMQEYFSFNEEEKSVCIQEYIRDKLRRDPDWLTSLIAFFHK